MCQFSCINNIKLLLFSHRNRFNLSQILFYCKHANHWYTMMTGNFLNLLPRSHTSPWKCYFLSVPNKLYINPHGNIITDHNLESTWYSNTVNNTDFISKFIFNVPFLTSFYDVNLFFYATDIHQEPRG